VSINKINEIISTRFQVGFPDEFVNFLQAQQDNAHQLYRIDSGKTLIEFLNAQGVPRQHFAALLSADSRLLPKLDYPALLELAPDELYTYFLDHFSSMFYLQEVALDSKLKTGFNLHGIEHLRTIVKNSTELLRELKSAPLEQRHAENETIIGAFFHDIGNIISRQYHGFYGIYLLTQLFKNYDVDEQTLESFLNVLEIVLFHEVEYGSRLPTLTLLRPSTLSVIIADKTDVGFKRVSSKSNVPEAIRDAHVLVNLLVARSTTRRIKGTTGRFQWTIDFKSKFDSSHIELFSELLKATGRVKVPKEWQVLYESGNIEYLFVFNATFLRVYLSRLYFAMRAVFALYNSVDQFEFVVDDAERGISLKRVFTPDDYQDKVYTLGKYFYRQDWLDSYLCKALEQQSALASSQPLRDFAKF
jgi:metal-dependent HD superfamily phosphatase/phosphodiesterase